MGMTMMAPDRAATSPRLDLSSVQLCGRAGITYRQLDRWCHLGILRPTASNGRPGIAPGSGSQRRFTRREARVASLIARLNELGVASGVLAQVAEQVRGFTADEWHGEAIVSRRGTVGVVRQGDAVTFGEACWVVNLDLCAARAAA